VLLQAGQLLSSAGSQSTAIVYTFLTLSLTNSPAKAGVVGFARTVPIAVLSILGGATADRADRKRVMILADIARLVAVGGLALAILTGHVSFGAIVVVALVEGAGLAFFSPAASGALRSVVPGSQLGDAAGAEEARRAMVGLAGPPVGGALYGLGRAVPFVLDAISYVFSLASILLMRTPFQEARARETEPLRARVALGLRFVWRQPFLRTTALIFLLLNMVGLGFLFVLSVVGKGQGLSAGEVGLLVAAFGAAMLVGSLVSPVARRHLPPGAILTLELWTWPLSAVYVLWPNVYVLAAAMLPCGFAIPITNAALISYRLAITPDRLVGRVVSVQTAIFVTGAPIGALGAGVLLDTVGSQATVGAFAAAALVLAVWATLSPSIRTVPKFAALERAS
jgi:MFS family permease